MEYERGEAIDVTGLSDADYLEIRGFTSVDGIFIANRLEQDDFADTDSAPKQMEIEDNFSN